MKHIVFLTLALLLCVGCARNGEYRYTSTLSLIEPAETLVPKITERLRNSEFRKNYDQTLVDRIGSSFKNFRHIRAYQSVLEDALVYIMIKTDTPHLSDGMRNALIPPISKLILSHRSGDTLIAGLDKIVGLIKEKDGEALIEALNAYNAELIAEGDSYS